MEYGINKGGNMVDYISFTETRINKVQVNDRIRDTIPSLSVTRLKKGNKIVFRWKKRIKGTGEYPEFTLGSFPAMSISKARRKAMEFDELAEQGIHPRRHEEELKAEKMKTEISLRQAIEDYTSFRLEFNSSSTVDQRRNVLHLVFEEYLDKPLNYLTAPRIINRYQEWRTQRKAPNRKDKNGSPYTARLAMRYLNSIFNYVVGMEFMDRNPMTPIIKPMQIFKKSESKGLYLKRQECVDFATKIKHLKIWRNEATQYTFPTNEELQKAKGYKETWRSWHSLVGYELMELLFYTGLRVGDVARLKWDTVFLDGNEDEEIPHFTLKIQKNQDRLFAIPITRMMYTPLANMKAMELDSPYVFPDIVDTKALFLDKKPKVNKKGEVLDKLPTYMLSSKKKLKARYKLKSELRINKDRGYGSTIRVCENIENYIYPNGFKFEKTTKMMPQLLRHNFASHARESGLNLEQIQMITGHSNSFDDREMGNATLNYVRNMVTVNQPLYKHVGEGLMGMLYEEIELTPQEKYFGDRSFQGNLT